jgi:hypothetical protein
MKDVQYAAIHNSFRQQMEGERPLITAVLGGSGYFERRNPDEGSDIFVKTRNRSIRVPEKREVKNFIALNRQSISDSKRRARPVSAKGRIESHQERQQRVGEEQEQQHYQQQQQQQHDVSLDLSFGDKMGRLAEAQEEIRAEQFGTRAAGGSKPKPRPQSARVASGRSATEWGDWDRNSVAAGAQSARSAEAWSSWDVNATERAQAVAAANEKFNMAHAATGRSDERWSEWDQTARPAQKKPQRPQSARPVLMSTTQPQQQQHQTTGRSAEDWGAWDVSRTARAAGANARSVAPQRPQSARAPVKTRSLVAEEFVSSREMTLRMSGRPQARGLGEPLNTAPMRIPQGINSRAAISAGLNHPASSAPLPGMGPAVRSIAVNREIAAAVETVFDQGGIPRPVDFVPSRVNDIAKTEPKGPTVDRPSESHRTFLRNLEKMARQAGLTIG